MKSLALATKLTVALALSSCATGGSYAVLSLVSLGAYGGYYWMTRPTVEKAIDDAQVVKQPKTGKLGKSMILLRGHGGIATESYTKSNQEVCFTHNTENSNYRYQLGLVRSKEEAEKPLAYHTDFRSNVKDAQSHTYAYESTETTKYKDSSGKTIATAERPVTKYDTVTNYTIEVCFPDVELVRDDDFYMVVGMDTSKNSELDDNAGFAAWRVTR